MADRALAVERGRVALVERVPIAAAGDVVVAVAYAGVCRTDLAVADGAIAVEAGRVIGHELSGVVVDAGAGVAIGSRVAVIPFSACGACASCVARATFECESPRWLGVDRDGAFADHVCVPESSLVALPEGMSLVLGAYVEPVAAAMGALSSIERGDRVLVEGRGRIAELTARVIAAHGAAVTRSIDARGEAPRFDVVVETSGGAVEPLLALLRPRGTLVLKSRARRSVALPADVLVARELVVRGASHGSFATAVDWLHTRRIVVDDLIAKPRPLAEFAAVLADAHTSEAEKQMFEIAGDRASDRCSNSRGAG